MTPEGLVEVPEQASRTWLHRATVGIVLFSSAFVILGTTFLDVRYRLPEPKLTGSEAAAYARQQKEATWSDGSLARLTEYRYRVRSRVRNYLGKPYATFLLRNLAEAGPDVLVGDDGWMFLTDRVAFTDSYARRGIELVAAEQSALARRLGSQGIRLVLIPLPRKAALYGEHLPHGYRGRRYIDEAVLHGMRAMGVETIDTLPAWDQPSEEPLYRRRDTHWATEGLRRTSQATAGQIGRLAPPWRTPGRDRTGVGNRPSRRALHIHQLRTQPGRRALR